MTDNYHELSIKKNYEKESNLINDKEDIRNVSQI